MATTEVICLETLGIIVYSLIFINPFLHIWELLAVGGNILLLTNIGQKDTIAFLTLLFKPSIEYLLCMTEFLEWGRWKFLLYMVVKREKIWQPTKLFGFLNIFSFVPIAAINSQQLGFFKELFSCLGVKTIEPRLVDLPFRLFTMSTATHITFSW